MPNQTLPTLLTTVLPELSVVIQRMVGFRNLVVHGYQSLNPAILQDLVVHRLDNLLAFVGAIRSRLPDS